MTVAQALKIRFFLIVNFCYNYFFPKPDAVCHQSMAWLRYQAVVFCQLSESIRRVWLSEDKAVIIGIGIGYPDLSVKVNHLNLAVNQSLKLFTEG